MEPDGARAHVGAHSLTVHASRWRVPSVPLHVDPEWAMKRRRQEPPWLLGPAVRSHTRPPLLHPVPSGRVTETICHGVGQSISGFTFWGQECQRIGGLTVTLHRCRSKWQATSLGLPSEGESPWPSYAVATGRQWAGGEQARDTPALWIFCLYHCHIQFSIQQVFYFVLILLFFEKEEATEMYWHWEMGSKLYVSLKQPTNQPAKLLLCLCSVVSNSFVTPLDSSPPGSSVHGILQASILEWVAIPFSRGSSWPSDQTHVSCISCIGRQILHHCAPWEAPDVTIDSSDIHYELKF